MDLVINSHTLYQLSYAGLTLALGVQYKYFLFVIFVALNRMGLSFESIFQHPFNNGDGVAKFGHVFQNIPHI